MSVNLLKLGSSLSTVVTDLQEAQELLGATSDLVQMAEAAAAGTGATGAQKLAAVKAGLQAFVADRMPKYTAVFDQLWTQFSAVIASMVAIFNTLGVFPPKPAATTV